MKRRRKPKPASKVSLAAIALVIGLFAMTGNHDEAGRLLAQIGTMVEARPRAEALVGAASVIDGDTMDVHGTRVRLHAIDAPESRQLCYRGRTEWRCGQQAALALQDKIARRPVTCEERDIDRYGRVVAACFVGGENLNAWMVRQGHAVAYRQYGRDYISHENAAKAEGRGVWSGTFTMPWDWRRR